MAKKTLLDRMKEKAAEAEKRKEDRKNFESTNWFKPTEGDNRLRILPHRDDPEENLPFEERKIHYVPRKRQDGTPFNGPLRCLSDDGKECPICDAWVAEKAANPKSKLASDLRPARRVLMNIINYGVKGERTEPVIQVWSCPESVHEEVLGWLGDLNEFWDLDSGRNWRLRKTVDKKRGIMMGTEYKIYPDMKDSSVPEKFRALLAEAADLSKIWTFEPIEEYYNALKNLGVGDADDEDEDDEEEELTVRSKKGVDFKKRLKKKVEEEEEEEEEEEPVAPVRKSLPKKKAVVVEEEEEEEEEEVRKPLPKKKSPLPKKEEKPKGKSLDDELGIEDDLEEELRSLGI